MTSIKNLTVLLIITGLIFTGFGYWVLPRIISQPVVKQESVVIKQGDDSFDAGLTAAYNRLIARGHADIAVPGYGYQASTMISGTIKEIKDGKIILQISPVNALADPLLDERAVIISGKTKIYQQIGKTPEQLQQDNEAFSKQMEEFSQKMKEQKAGEQVEPPRPPEPFAKQEIKPSDLQVGQRIMTIADQNIHQDNEFTVIEIVAQPILIAPNR